MSYFFFPKSETQVLCSQVPSVAACSPSSVSEIDLNQIEGAVQDLCVTPHTQPTVDLGNQIKFEKEFICFQFLILLTYSMFSHQIKMDIFPL